MVANEGQVKILDFLKPSAIKLDIAATTKKEALEELVGLLAADGSITDPKAVLNVLMEREAIGSTGIGQGIAIPHAKTDQTKTVMAACGISRRGVQFAALDEQPVHILFLLIAPPDAAAIHLTTLGRISRLLKNKFFRQTLRGIKDTAEVVRFIREEDQY